MCMHVHTVLVSETSVVFDVAFEMVCDGGIHSSLLFFFLPFTSPINSSFPPLPHPPNPPNPLFLLFPLPLSPSSPPSIHFSNRNLFGMTPFMFAVYRRSYHMAIELFQLAMSLTDQPSVLMSAVCPPDSHPDDSPLFILCRNDSCSFTWTGEEHINQDIFECRTCDIVESYCCCTECAYTCHRGHDCS